MALYSMVKNHKTYLKAMRLAGEYIQDPDEFNSLIADAQEKLSAAAVTARDAVYEGLDIMLRMMAAYAKGEYRAIPWRTLLIITAAVLYFVMPLDFLPDLLPIIGFADDVAIIVWTFNLVKHDIDQFLIWEKAQQPAIETPAPLPENSTVNIPPSLA
jgi:uncharacterized membrane protein YkvA (DUF1232 family)